MRVEVIFGFLFSWDSRNWWIYVFIFFFGKIVGFEIRKIYNEYLNIFFLRFFFWSIFSRVCDYLLGGLMLVIYFIFGFCCFLFVVS